MKRYTPKVVSKWIAAANFIGKKRPAKPFPGKAPTRIMLSSIDGKRVFTYIGKPSREIKRAHDNFLMKPCTSMNAFTFYIEFDRSGIVTMSRNQLGQLPNRNTNADLWAHYHPELMAEHLPNWLRYNYKVVDGVYKIA